MFSQSIYRSPFSNGLRVNLRRMMAAKLPCISTIKPSPSFSFQSRSSNHRFHSFAWTHSSVLQSHRHAQCNGAKHVRSNQQLFSNTCVTRLSSSSSLRAHSALLFTSRHSSSLAPSKQHSDSAAINEQGNAAQANESSISSSFSPSSNTVADSNLNEAKESRLRRLIRQYGAVAIGSYLVIYVSTLGMIYIAIKERMVGGVDVQHWIDMLGLSERLEHIDPRSGDFAVAWIATKFTEPIRLALTVALTPTIARLVGRAPPKQPKDASDTAGVQKP